MSLFTACFQAMRAIRKTPPLTLLHSAYGAFAKVDVGLILVFLKSPLLSAFTSIKRTDTFPPFPFRMGKADRSVDCNPENPSAIASPSSDTLTSHSLWATRYSPSSSAAPATAFDSLHVGSRDGLTQRRNCADTVWIALATVLVNRNAESKLHSGSSRYSGRSNFLVETNMANLIRLCRHPTGEECNPCNGKITAFPRENNPCNLLINNQFLPCLILPCAMT